MAALWPKLALPAALAPLYSASALGGSGGRAPQAAVNASAATVLRNVTALVWASNASSCTNSSSSSSGSNTTTTYSLCNRTREVWVAPPPPPPPPTDLSRVSAFCAGGRSFQAERAVDEALAALLALLLGQLLLTFSTYGVWVRLGYAAWSPPPALLRPPTLPQVKNTKIWIT